MLATALLLLAIALAGCSQIDQWISLPAPQDQPVVEAEGSNPDPALSDQIPVVSDEIPLPETEVSFRVTVPENTPGDTTVYLTLVDEVTGLALNAEQYPMQPLAQEEGETSTRQYAINLVLPVHSVIKYRYERQAGGVTVAEHLSGGEPVRYRLYAVEGPGVVEDVVSRWTDTAFTYSTGRIMGQATDAGSGQPLANLLVSAGGAQTFTSADGSFLLEGLPPGVHNLVIYALDGAYRTFQQGALVSPGSTTPAPVALEAAPVVNVMFVVQVPEGTPPVVPLRMAGNLAPLGNTFATLAGGGSVLPSRMPVLNALPDGRYTVTLALPAGADLRYKYTLGDGFWNAEHAEDGEFVLRQLIVPEQEAVIEDVVASWQTSSRPPLVFDVRVPESTPPGEQISIQFHPIFGWNEPLPMWRLGPDRWAYALYGPLNLPGELTYRFCRNNQCSSEEYPIDLSAEQAQSDQQQVIANWPDYDPQAAAYQDIVLPENAAPRGPDYVAGIAFEPGYHPAWNAILPATYENLVGMGANWAFLTPTWSYTRQDQIVFQPVAGRDPSWTDLSAAIRQANDAGLKVVLYPQAAFPAGGDAWWTTAPRDFGWWLVWFERYRTFALHFARLAAETNTPGLLLGGEWVNPALPGGLLPDGAPSGVPADAEERWRALFADIRAVYGGSLLWAIPAGQMASPPPFIDAVDGLYLIWDDPMVPQGDGPDPVETAARQLDIIVRPMQLLYNKALILGARFSSAEGAQAQAEAYQRLFGLVSERDWIAGVISEGYYAPAPVQDASASVNGKPAAEVIRAWFQRLRSAPPQ